MNDPKRDLLRHAVATLAYRGGKAVRNAPAGFSEFRGCPSGRPAGRILAHIGDLLDWALSIAQGEQRWNNSKPLPWDEETDRFFAALKSFGGILVPKDLARTCTNAACFASAQRQMLHKLSMTPFSRV